MKSKVINLGIVVAVLLGFLVGHNGCRNDPGETLTTRVDTLVIRDTIRVTEPKYITRRVIDSIPYPVTDTIRLRDTLFLLLERQQVTWEDSLARVYASGVNPRQLMVSSAEISNNRSPQLRWALSSCG